MGLVELAEEVGMPCKSLLRGGREPRRRKRIASTECGPWRLNNP